MMGEWRTKPGPALSAVVSVLRAFDGVDNGKATDRTAVVAAL
jgi:hypothetical protein